MQRYTLRDYIEKQTEMKKVDMNGDENGRASSNTASTESSADYLAKEDPITSSTVRDFLKSFQRGDLKKSLFSEEHRNSDVAAALGGEKEGMVKSGAKGRKLNVKPLVGSNFREKHIQIPPSTAWATVNKDIFVYVLHPKVGTASRSSPCWGVS